MNALSKHISIYAYIFSYIYTRSGVALGKKLLFALKIPSREIHLWGWPDLILPWGGPMNNPVSTSEYSMDATIAFSSLGSCLPRMPNCKILFKPQLSYTYETSVCVQNSLVPIIYSLCTIFIFSFEASNFLKERNDCFKKYFTFEVCPPIWNLLTEIVVFNKGKKWYFIKFIFIFLESGYQFWGHHKNRMRDYQNGAKVCY